MAERAGEDVGERLARDDAQAFGVVAACRPPSVIDWTSCVAGRSAVEPCVWIVTFRALRASTSKPIRVVSSQALTSRLLTSASVRRAPMISVPLCGDLGARPLRALERHPQRRPIDRVCPSWISGSEMRNTTSRTVPSRGLIDEADLVALLRLRPCRLRLWRQLLATVFVDVEQDAVLGHVGVEPCALSGDERLAVDGETIVLVALGEQVLLPDDAECRALVFAELGVLGEEAVSCRAPGRAATR